MAHPVDVIAIDFGTSRTKLAYWDPTAGRPELMRHAPHDYPFCPSLVYLPKESEKIVWGTFAEDMLDEDCGGIVDVFKRRLRDPYVRANRRRVEPRHALAALFGALRRQAAAELPPLAGRLPDRLVLTRPVKFGPDDDAVLRAAADDAGFSTIELVFEPVAAARAWTREIGDRAEDVVVFDGGGGTVDWAYLRRCDGDWVPATDPPPDGLHLGGHDVDLALLDLLIDKAGADAERLIRAEEVRHLRTVRRWKERCGTDRDLPLPAVTVAGRTVAVTGAEVATEVEHVYTVKVVGALQRFIDRVGQVRDRSDRLRLLLVGGSSRQVGVAAALQDRLGVEPVGWDRADYAIALGAVPTVQRKPPVEVLDAVPSQNPQPDSGSLFGRLFGRQSDQVQSQAGPGGKQHQSPLPPRPSAARPPVEILEGSWPNAKCVFRDWGPDGRSDPTLPQMVVIPAGRFTMGSPSGEPERTDAEGPQHEVVISRPFALGRFAMTQAEWAALMGENPSKFKGDRNPVECVSWEDAKAFIAKLNAKLGLSEQAGYRLPSEAEWEYACRAGTKTPFWWGSTIMTDQANYDGNFTYNNGKKGQYREKTVPVDGFEPNPWGLYQVHGNVWEWCEDCWNDNYNGAPKDGTAWATGNCEARVLRGGSWNGSPGGVRSACRNGYTAGVRDDFVGFRLARTFPHAS